MILSCANVALSFGPEHCCYSGFPCLLAVVFTILYQQKYLNKKHIKVYAWNDEYNYYPQNGSCSNGSVFMVDFGPDVTPPTSTCQQQRAERPQSTPEKRQINIIYIYSCFIRLLWLWWMYFSVVVVAVLMQTLILILLLLLLLLLLLEEEEEMMVAVLMVVVLHFHDIWVFFPQHRTRHHSMSK